MAVKFYGATSLLGGTATSLDGISSAVLAHGDGATVITDSYAYRYSYDAYSTSSVNTIPPSDVVGAGRWCLVFMRELFDIVKAGDSDGIKFYDKDDVLAMELVDGGQLKVYNLNMDGGTDIPILNGGTGASTASGARTNIGVAPTMSIDQSGSDIKLKNDEESPGNSKYYGTDGSGNKGWHSLS